MNRSVTSSNVNTTTLHADWNGVCWAWPLRFLERTVPLENEIAYLCATSYGYMGA